MVEWRTDHVFVGHRVAVRRLLQGLVGVVKQVGLLPVGGSASCVRKWAHWVARRAMALRTAGGLECTQGAQVRLELVDRCLPQAGGLFRGAMDWPTCR